MIKGLIGSLLFGIGRGIARVGLLLALAGLSMTNEKDIVPELKRYLDGENTLP